MTDVFAKAREFERIEQLNAARSIGALPYFHVLDGPAGPVVEMEGRRRIMLGSNNYLGLTSDQRVIAGARDALDKYGTGLTGSRFLNGTIDLHVELAGREPGERRVDSAFQLVVRSALAECLAHGENENLRDA